MERIAAENEIEIEFLRSGKSFRKEDRVKEVLENAGSDPQPHPNGDGAGAPAMSHGTIRNLQDIPEAGRWQMSVLLPLLINEDLGLGSLWMPTLCPFRLQFAASEAGRIRRSLLPAYLRRLAGRKALHPNAFPAM